MTPMSARSSDPEHGSTLVDALVTIVLVVSLLVVVRSLAGPATQTVDRIEEQVLRAIETRSERVMAWRDRAPLYQDARASPGPAPLRGSPW
ncbi:MAG: hypothetical protein ACOC1U_07935 [Spirochaetota bacterium]